MIAGLIPLMYAPGQGQHSASVLVLLSSLVWRLVRLFTLLYYL